MKHYDAMIVGLGVVLAVLMTVGCSANVKTPHDGHSHAVKTPPIPHLSTVTNGRCKTLGKSVTRNASVLVERNCFRNGVTTVGIVVHNKKDGGKAAAVDSVKAVTRILGFRPTLTTIFLGKTHGHIFILSAVTGYKPNTAVALRK